MVTRLSDTVVKTQHEAQFRNSPSDNSGLSFLVKEGFVYSDLGTFTEVEETNLVLPDNSINIIYIDTILGTITSAVIGGEDVSNTIRLYQVTTSSGAITSIVDQRVRGTTV